MMKKKYVLYEPGGALARGFDRGELLEVRYVEVVPTDIASADRDKFVDLIKDLDSSYLEQCRVGLVDDRGVGYYCSVHDFLAGTEDLTRRPAFKDAEPSTA